MHFWIIKKSQLQYKNQPDNPLLGLKGVFLNASFEKYFRNIQR